MENDPLPPLSAALLAQAERIEPGRAIVVTDEDGIIEVDDPRWQVVTWRGNHATHDLGTIATAPAQAHNQSVPV